MASPSSESSMSEHSEVPTSATIFRDNGPLSQALRSDLTIEVVDIARLDRHASPPPEPVSSPNGPSISAPTPHDNTTTRTRTTMIETHKGKGKAKAKTGYASSVSAAHGSASEAEFEHKFIRRSNLFALGEWVHSGDPGSSRTLRGSARARELHYNRRKPKQKKPHVDMGRSSRTHVSSEGSLHSLVTSMPSYGTAGTTELGQSSLTHDDALQLMEEGRVSAPPSGNPFKLAVYDRPYVIPALLALEVIVITLSAYGAYLSGIAHLSCMKGIVFGAAIVSACLTVLVMLLARRNVVEAMFAGFIEFAIGFALVAELDDFM